MSFPAAAGDVLPPLPPIKTTVAAVAAPAPEPSLASPSTAPEAKPLPPPAEEEAEPTTPTSEESKLRTLTECPPAPRKPAWTKPAKRKSPSSSSPPPPASARRLFFAVPRDLSAVFRSLPPKKRIHAG